MGDFYLSWEKSDTDNPNVEARRRGMNLYDFKQSLRRKGDLNEIRRYFGNIIQEDEGHH